MNGDGNNEKGALTADIDSNINMIKKIFKDDDTLIARSFENRADPTLRFCVFYIDGMVDNLIFDEDVIRPLVENVERKHMNNNLIDVIASRVVLTDGVQKTDRASEIIQAIVYGDSVLLVSGCPEALILNTKGWVTRGIREPDDEKVLKGPREGFNESIIVNLSMLRRRLRTQKLKMKFKTFGDRSNTKGCICYIDGIADMKILSELENRLNKFSMDGALDVNYISEFISDAPYSPVETVGTTERPDSVAGKLLEGRIAVFLDGTPVVLTVPHLFIEHFQSSDDYYLNYFFASIGRILRMLGFFVSISTPAIYIALTTFHQEMLPTPLLVSIAMSRQNVPLPTSLEAVLMLIVFEILRETGIRMPNSIGQALSIVGALVIGQAAVDAKLVSSPMIIVVAISGITGLLVSRLKGEIIIMRFILLILSSIIGLYGYIFGMIGPLIYLLNINSFGVPIMETFYSRGRQSRKDLFVRSPWWSMVDRPDNMTADKKRSGSGDAR